MTAEFLFRIQVIYCASVDSASMGDKRGASPPPSVIGGAKKPKRSITFNSDVQTVRFDKNAAIKGGDVCACQSYAIATVCIL